MPEFGSGQITKSIKRQVGIITEVKPIVEANVPNYVAHFAQQYSKANEFSKA